MAQGTTQAQAPTPAEQPIVPSGTVQSPKGPAARKKAVVELTEAELQAISGGGSKPGMVGDGYGS